MHVTPTESISDSTISELQPPGAFLGTNPENAVNFCIARRSGGISAIVSGRLPRSGLLDRNNFRLAVIHQQLATNATWGSSPKCDGPIALLR